jgi:CelD/BcsL family acetyltransferase involved in cellulose biosynthesis
VTTVREINDPAELAKFGPTWNELVARTPQASFFHSFQWLQTYWQHFSAGKRLRILMVHEGNALLGILPLVRSTARRSEPFHVLAYPLDHWGNFYGPIGPDPPATLTSALNHLRRTPRDWHFLELGWVDAQADGGRTEQALESCGFPAIRETQDTTAIVDLTRFDSWDAYLAGHGGKWRQNLRQRERKVAALGEVTYVRYRSESRPSDPRWDLYDACVAISQASWQDRASRGTMLSKDVSRDFYRDCHRAAAAWGAVDLNLLYVDAVPVAFSYGYHHRGRVTGIKTAFDPAVGREGIGRVLQARQIADSLARADVLYDLGPEITAWKQLWMTGTRRIDCYTHFPRRAPVAQLVRAKRALRARWHKQERAAPAPQRAVDTVSPSASAQRSGAPTPPALERLSFPTPHP